MTNNALVEACPGCGARLPVVDGPTHRYIEASPACWGIYTALLNGGEPPLAPAPLNVLLTDAYAAQHPGRPSPQSIQSVAVHLLTLYGVLVKGIDPSRAIWLRTQVVQEDRTGRKRAYAWLTPPNLAGLLTIADVAQAPTPDARTEAAERYVQGVWAAWGETHGERVIAWYEALGL